MSKFDYSTINLEALRALPLYRLPRGNHLQEDPGNACVMDAPGYPTYFTRSVYNSRGDELRHGPYLVITDPDDEEKHYVVDSIDLRTLWISLPIGHPRFKHWEQACYIHWNKCYQDPTKPEYGKPGTLIWPIPQYVLNEVKAIHSLNKEQKEVTWTYDIVFDESYEDGQIKWGIKWNIKLSPYMYDTRAGRAWNTYIQEKLPLATPENHLTTHLIQGFYPEYHPNCNWIVKAPKEGYEPNNRWWERYAQPHTTEEGV